jgi:hypothetical protein
MKMIYTNENLFIVGNAKNILESHGIDVILKNEFSSGVVGEVSAFDAWIEIWVQNDSDYEKAFKIIENSLSTENAAQWRCDQCKEDNDASFEICWNCKTEHL